MNFYVYCDNDPVNFIDPDGELAFLAAIAIVWTVVEIALSVYDVVDTVGTFTDKNSSGFDKSVTAVCLFAGMALPGGGYGKAAKNATKKFSNEKQALVEMAKQDAKTGMTAGDLKAYKDLNKTLKDQFPTNEVRGPEAHPNRPHGNVPHGHVGPVNHIPIKD